MPIASPETYRAMFDAAKTGGYAYPAIFSVYTGCQLADPFFPTMFRNPYVLTALVLLPMVAAIMAMFTE